MTTMIRNTALATLALTILFASAALAVPGSTLVSLMTDINDDEAEYWNIDETSNNHSTSGGDDDSDDSGDEGKPVFTTG